MPNPSSGSRLFVPLLVLSTASGCSALIYEIVWYRLLQLAIGSTAISLGFLLAAFMGGLSLGSAGFSRLNLASRRPLRVYAALELGIAACGVLLLHLMPLITSVYFAGAATGTAGMLMRGLLCGICLLPPTMLMGASLPAIVRALEDQRAGAASWGWLYGVNTLGAVLGCLAAGFYLLRLYDVYVATYTAVGLNLLVALPAWRLSQPVSTGAELAESAAPAPIHWSIYAAIAFSGASALGAEVVWTRLMGMLLGSTVYVFSIILAVFLGGMAVGSTVCSWLIEPEPGAGRGAEWARVALGWCQVLLLLAIAWAGWIITASLPYWPINPFLSASPWYTFQIDAVRCLWAILPAALLWGASFPLAMAAAATAEADPGSVVGRIYAANTLGAIAGALGVSLILIPAFGTHFSQRALVALAALGAIAAFLPAMMGKQAPGKRIAAAIAPAVAAILAAILIRTTGSIPGEVVAYGRRSAIYAGRAQIIEVVEGRNSSVAISRWSDGATEIDVNGHVEATNEPFDMKLQRMVGHLPAIIHPNPRSVLGIGFGAGVSAGTFTRYPTIRHITVCEIEPVIPPTSTRYFGHEDYNVLHDPRTRIVYDDARHFVLTTTEKFDIIASDPLDVFVKGTAAIYSEEYFEAIRRHLNPGGMFTLYVPLYESDARTVKSELATFFAAFPNATVWANTIEGRGYDMVFMGQAEPLRIDLDAIETRYLRPDYAPVAESLSEIGATSPLALFATYAGRRADLGPWVEGAEINRDRDLRLQYLGGWGINSSLEDVIYRDMIQYRRPPEGLFQGSPERVAAALAQLGAAK
jgi:spermidine synthase